jgi:hypothetical protein
MGGAWEHGGDLIQRAFGLGSHLNASTQMLASNFL